MNRFERPILYLATAASIGLAGAAYSRTGQSVLDQRLQQVEAGLKRNESDVKDSFAVSCYESNMRHPGQRPLTLDECRSTRAETVRYMDTIATPTPLPSIYATQTVFARRGGV